MIILLLFCIDTCIPLYYTNLKNESLLKQQEVKRMDILCVGEMLADVLVHPVQNIHFNNDCTVVNEITIKPGGDSFNNSIDLAKLGNNVCYIDVSAAMPWESICSNRDRRLELIWITLSAPQIHTLR